MTAYDGVNDGMDQINHIHYIGDLYFPKGFNYRKASPEERKKVLESIDVNSAASQADRAVLQAARHGD